MRSRQDITDIFSTYIRFDSERFAGWLSEPRLHVNMSRCLTQVSDIQISKNFFALYWYQHWQQQRQNQSHRLALMHLGAYLQEAGYWAANKFTSRFSIQQFSLADCFQVGFVKLEKALSSFQPDRGATLESFAKLFFKSTIRNELRRAKELDLSSDWLMLRKLTRKQFIESMKVAGGLEAQAIKQHRLAWICFKQKYVEYKEAGTHQLSKPTPDTWADIATLYNQERISQLTSAAKPIDAATVEKWLLNVAKCARRYLYPVKTSLNAPAPGYDSGEAQDNLSDGFDQSLIDRALSEEAVSDRQSQQKTLLIVLRQTIEQLKSPRETMLRQYYCEGLKQQEIANQLGIHQGTVARRLNSTRETLLSALVKWRQEMEPAEVTPDAIADISDALEIWLQSSFCDA